MDRQISDYAVVGDCRTAALISRDGCVDWLCWPAFDSEACLAALLGGPDNGRWRLAPEGPAEVRSRRYLQDTLVLETRWSTPSGGVRVSDFMPMQGASALVRIVDCEAGCVEMGSQLALRFDYGSRSPLLTCRTGSATAIAGPNGVQLHAEAALEVEGGDCTARWTMRQGDSCAFVLSYFPSHLPPPERPDPREALAATIREWSAWTGRCTYRGEWREAVSRSLVTLKALTYRPTGGLVAAVTSSIPESPVGGRTWDYRYCWLRDATFTLLSLLEAGYEEEAGAWRDWLLRAAGGSPGQLQPLYTVRGRARTMEWEAPWLPGMNGSGPVRFGNAASEQLQLDAYGEVIDVLFQAERKGVPTAEAEPELRRAVLETVERIWRKPGHGIWEVRGRPQRFTQSMVMAWAAMDRAVQWGERQGLDQTEHWRALRGEMRREILEGCYDPKLRAFTQAHGSRVLDASVLLMPHVGFLPADDPRMVSTVEALRRELDEQGFLRRYRPEDTDDGVGGEEGAFLACSFWLADNLVMQGRRQEAVEIFERLLSVRNEVGLLSEEYDIGAGRLVGNFPQALSHLSLINTACSLAGGGPNETRAREAGEPASGGAVGGRGTADLGDQ